MPESQTGFVNINGADIYYEITGQGQTLVFLHAGICDMRMWDDQVLGFAPHYRVLRYDQRGYGQTKPVEGKYDSVTDLKTLLDHFRVQKAVLVGCSMGGMIAMDFTLLHPEYVQALVMVGSNPTGYKFTVDPPPIWQELKQAWDSGDLDRVAEIEVKVWVDGEKRTPDEVPAHIRDKVRQMNLIALKNERLGIGERKESTVNAVDRLKEIAVPVLVVIGDMDDLELMEAADLMTTQILDSEKVIINHTAHLPGMEKPDVFNRHLTAFLRQVQA